MKIGLVVTPLSRRNRRHPREIERLRAVVGELGLVRSVSTREELADAARSFRSEGVEVLAIGGGDGTNHVTLTGFFEVYGDEPLPKIALLRGGTMNTVANACGVRRGGPVDLLRRLVEERDASRLRTTERHVLWVSARDQAGQDSRQCGFLFGVGVVHGFLAEYYRGGEPSPAVAVRTLARGVASAAVGGTTIRRMARPYRGAVVVDGARWPEREYLTVAGGAVDQIGLGFRPFPRASERAGSFQILGIHTSPLGFSLELPRVFRGKPLPERKVFDALTTHARLEPTEARLEYMIDGDLHTCEGPLEVRSGPAIRLLV